MQTGLDRHKIKYTGNVDAVSHLIQDVVDRMTDVEINRFLRLLQKYGLHELEVAVLVEKFVNSRTLEEITEEHGITSPGVCFYIYKKALGKLVERGIEQELKRKVDA